MGVLIHVDRLSNETEFFDLDEFLDAIRPWGEPLTWSICDLWATVAEQGCVYLTPSGTERVVTGDRARLDPVCGDIAAPMSFAALAAFAACTHQVIDGLFVGVEEGGLRRDLPRLFEDHIEYLHPDETWFRSYPLVVHAFDSTYWRVFVRDDAAAGALRERFPHATELARW